MELTCRRRLAIALLAVVPACGNPAGPDDAGYAGQWSGTTAQGRAIDFTISAQEMVTAITVGHAFNGCAGSQTFSNLSLAITPAEGTINLRNFSGCGDAIGVAWSAGKR